MTAAIVERLDGGRHAARGVILPLSVFNQRCRVRLRARQVSGRRVGCPVVVIGALVTGLACIGSVETTWSFSAFTVLVYYAITNLAALRLPAEARLYPGWIPAAGLAGCLGLAFWVEPRVWLVGLALIGVGLLGRVLIKGRNG